MLQELGDVAAIIVTCVAAAVFYGVVHDQITARICVEYFTIGHENLLGVDPHTASPTKQGLLWGVIATWWVGLVLGVGAALAAKLGTWPRWGLTHLVPSIAGVLAFTACCALVAGLAGNLLATRGLLTLPPGLASAVPPERHAGFLTDAYAHTASYGAGALGAVVVVVRTVWLRARQGP